ncbi:MAG TPA: DinB family protein [Gemmatimonadaceae bacterium]|nr:DinB family protein [Gemmatimonadaceae bacterium]
MAKASPTRKSGDKKDTPFQVLFPDFDSETAATRRMLERVPNGHNDYRPHAKSRSLGELAGHVAQLPGFGVKMATQDEFVGNPQRPDPKIETTAERLKIFDQLSTQLRAALEPMTWEQVSQPWTLKIGDRVAFQAPRSTVIRTVYITHTAHHRAQIGVYLRMLDVAVPWTYGGSADEQVPTT